MTTNNLEDHFDFLVTGPPRSGSAFISVFLSFGLQSYCWHEPYASNKIFHLNESDRLVGASCCSFAVLYPLQFSGFSKPKLFLSRNLEESVSSYNKQFSPAMHNSNIDMFRRSYLEASKSCGMQFDITKDVNIDSLKSVWEYMLPSIPFNERWANHCLLMEIKLKSLTY